MRNKDFSVWNVNGFVKNPDNDFEFMDGWVVKRDGLSGLFSLSCEVNGNDDRPFLPRTYLKIAKTKTGSGQTYFNLVQTLEEPIESKFVNFFAMSKTPVDIVVNGVRIFLNDKWTSHSVYQLAANEIVIELPINQTFEILLGDFQVVANEGDVIVWKPIVSMTDDGMKPIYAEFKKEPLTTYVRYPQFLRRGDQEVVVNHQNPEYQEIMANFEKSLVSIVNYRELKNESRYPESTRIELYKAIDDLETRGLSKEAVKMLEECLK